MSAESPGNARRFEELLTSLRETVGTLESAELTLEESVAAYERCVELANACTSLLDAAELRISRLAVEAPRMREQPSIYSVTQSSVSRLLLGDDEDLVDLVDEDDE